MTAPGSQTRSIGWMATLAACVGLVGALTFNVHAVKSEVSLAEREVISLQREIQMLETEFQARASQRQLADWNAIELGYEAPRADQYLEGERQLASLGVPVSPDAPAPIRVARAEPVETMARTGAMVSPVSGQPVALSAGATAEPDMGEVFAAAFGDFVIDASPIRAAHASTGLMETVASEAVE